MLNYGKRFFEAQQGGSLRSAQEIVPHLIELFTPQSVIDVGCGIGTWLSVFATHGIKDICGVDGSYVGTSSLLIPPDRFISMNLAKPLPLERKFDLVISLEVAEHIPVDNADLFIDFLTSLGSVIIFSAAIPFQAGHNHVNEQWQEFWLQKFDERGYIAFDHLRAKFWNNSKIKFWYSQNTIIYIEQSYLTQRGEIGKVLQNRNFPVSIIHPKQYARFADPEEFDLRIIGLKKILLTLPQLIWNSFYGRMKS